MKRKNEPEKYIMIPKDIHVFDFLKISLEFRISSKHKIEKMIKMIASIPVGSESKSLRLWFITSYIIEQIKTVADNIMNLL